MSIFLLVISIISACIGGYFFSQAKSAMHEITATLFFVISAVLFSRFAIVESIDKYTNYLKGKLGEK